MAEQGETYAGYIESELEREYQRRDSLDARGVSILTVNSALLTLVFSLSVLVRGENYQVQGASAYVVGVSLLCFLMAGLMGILANRTRKYEVTSGKTLQRMVDDHWTDDEVDARNVCAARRVTTIVSLRRGNDSKARQITVALGFQLAALLALGASIGPGLVANIL